MPRENSFTDSDGERSLTPDLDDELENERAFAASQANHAQPPASAAAANGDGMISSPARQQTPLMANLATAAMKSQQSIKSGPKSPTKSTKTHRTNRTHRQHPQKVMTPKERFRNAAQKIIQMRRTSTFMARGKIGAEPGIDANSHSAFMNYGHIRQKCLIDIIDYSSLRVSRGSMTNGELIQFLKNPEASAREPWVKVRWINVGGLSWDVISSLALKYNLHPLALEDLLHQRSHGRSKADYYPQHLFLRVLCHTLASEPTTLSEIGAVVSSSSPQAYTTWSSGKTITNLPRSSSPVSLDANLGIVGHDASMDDYGDEKLGVDGLEVEDDGDPNGRQRKYRMTSALTANDLEANAGRTPSFMESKRKRAAAAITIEQLKKGERVNVRISPMCIFLFRDGTVITMHPDPNLDFTLPITERLFRSDTTLRKSADPSLLVESLLDLVVDQALEVVDEYHAKIHKLERAVLIKPQVKNVRDLHVLSGDLILHKRTLGPVQTVIYGLRRYDVDRCAALVDTTDADAPIKVVGYMSHKSKIYLADVHDHMEHIMTSLDMYTAMSENLINYTFNMASYEMNEVMRRLTLATIVFLPLTLLTGYFGMNFENMWSINHDHSDLIFWIIALPMMAIVVPLFTGPDIMRTFHYLKKKMIAKKVKKEIKRE